VRVEVGIDPKGEMRDAVRDGMRLMKDWRRYMQVEDVTPEQAISPVSKKQVNWNRTHRF